MISYYSMLRKLLTERMSFRDILSRSESGRKQRASDVNVRPTVVTTLNGKEAWTFRYKSNPSTTGKNWTGYIQFFKDDVSLKDNAEDLDCIIDCSCPDYRYRLAYPNQQAGIGITGQKSWNKNNGRRPRPRSQGGVGMYKPGGCKHLCALSEYLKTVIEPNAPQPDDEIPPAVKKKSPPKPQPPVSKKPPTTLAPKPEDSYTDSRTGSDTYADNRTGSDTLREMRSPLYTRLDAFVNANPSFTVDVPDDEENINETVLFEEHDRGEWWIDESGNTVFADGDVGDANHEAVVIMTLASEILSHFGIDSDPEGSGIVNYEDSIKQTLIDDDRMDEDELQCWDNIRGSKLTGGPAAVILRKLIEDKVYSDPKQAEDALDRKSVV
jgi:hypothetical protein